MAHYLKTEDLSAQQMSVFLTITKNEADVVKCLLELDFTGKMFAQFGLRDYDNLLAENNQRVFYPSTVRKLLHLRDRFRYGIVFGEKSQFKALLDYNNKI